MDFEHSHRSKSSKTAAQIPASICLLRLSALGDVTHVVPLVRTLQRGFPETRLDWIIDQAGYQLLTGLTGVHFHVYDKHSGWSGWWALRQSLAQQPRFSVLLHLQTALRANLLALAVSTHRRIGYDRQRARDGHSLFVDERIRAHHQQHVLDAIGSFSQPLGLTQTEVRWDLPISPSDHAWANAQWPADGQKTLIISPCSSHRLRNWLADRYAAVANHAHQQHWRVVLCGGSSALEQCMAEQILAHSAAPIINLVGKDTLKQLAALLARADLVLSPDSGPMHIANAMGTPVLGLHAASHPGRSGPYSDRRFCVNRYDDAARRYLQTTADALPWGTKIEQDGVMALISVTDVIHAFERFRDQAPGP